MSFLRRTIRLLAVMAVMAGGTANAQSPLFNYQGADRMDRIVAAARKEGALTVYTTFAEKDQPTLIKPFETMYGVEVNRGRVCSHHVRQPTVAGTARVPH